MKDSNSLKAFKCAVGGIVYMKAEVSNGVRGVRENSKQISYMGFLVELFRNFSKQ